ncbi:MAG: hypothetical protein LBR57_04305 [Alistipes sp.]|jgi:hypothetical protein|nr:hypothetical protein [Alistipes sp.]
MKTKLLLSAMLACALLGVACTKEGGESKTYGKINFLDITDAEYLYTTRAGGNTRADGDGLAHLFKMVASGNVEEVVIKDENGDEVPATRIKISQVTDNLIFFGIQYGNVAPAYFIRKSDGAAFEIPEILQWSFDWHGYIDSNSGAIRVRDQRTVYVDKQKNIFVLTSNAELYKVSYSGQGISAVKTASNVRKLSVDWEGNVFYMNDYDNLWCIAADGTAFQVEEQIEDLPIYFPEYSHDRSELTFFHSFPQRDGGGFLYMTPGRWYLITVNAGEKRAEQQLIFETTDTELIYHDNRAVSLANKILAKGAVIIRSDLSTKTLEKKVPVESTSTAYTTNHAYWTDQTAVWDFNAETEETTAVHTFNTNVECSNFSYADGLILFTMTDRTREKRFRCEIRNGVYSEEEITSAGSETPEMIDFIRVN